MVTDEPTMCWIVGGSIALWHVGSTRWGGCLDRWLRDKGRWQACKQWYFFAALAMMTGMAHSFKNLCEFDMIGYHFLGDPHLQANVPKDQLETVTFPTWLKRAAMIAPLAALFAFILNMYHVYKFITSRATEKESDLATQREGNVTLRMGDHVKVKKKTGGESPARRENAHAGRTGEVDVIHRDSQGNSSVKVRFRDDPEDAADWFEVEELAPDIDENELNPYKLDNKDQMTVVILIMPGLFLVMAMFAELRALEIFTGSVFPQAKTTWEDYVLWRRSTLEMDLECAAAFQYVTVFAFAALCCGFFGIHDLEYKVEQREKELILQNNLLKRKQGQDGDPVQSSLKTSINQANKDHEFALTYAGLQGIGFYIFVGIIRAVFNIFASLANEHGYTNMSKLWVKTMTRVQPVFVCSTVLCVYNWIIIQRVRELTRPEALGEKATLKFIAVRILLLVADSQKSFLAFIVAHKPFGLVLLDYQATFCQVLLLILECVLVILWNSVFWGGWTPRKDIKIVDLHRRLLPVDGN